MAYKPTGRPPGRPKSSDMLGISVRLPESLLDHAKRYADHHHESLSTLIREGLVWRITDGDSKVPE